MGDGSAPPAAGPSAVPGYELLDEVGRGGMGVVYRARDLALGRDVAVKLLAERYAPDSPAARRFLDEARITGQLQHPGIPAVHQVGTLPDGRPFLAMKLIKGRTLDELLRDRPDPAAERGRLLAVFEKVCEAVGYAHAHGVIHRDLKPGNVMVGAFGEVQVMDWGLAKVLTGRGVDPAGPDPDATTLGTEIHSARGEDAATQAGSLLGTPAYMPPEQAIGAVDQIDQRSDVFGLGGVLCAVLTGKPPYVGDTAESTRQMAARTKLDDALARLAACGAEPDLVTLARRCLSAEKADRPADAGEVAAAVAGLRADAEQRARAAELSAAEERVRATEERKRRRVKLVLGGLAAVALAGAAVAAAYTRQLGRANERTAAALGQAEDANRGLEAANQVAEDALGQARRAMYFLRIAEADRAWWANNPGRTRAILTSSDIPAERRQWEWHYLNRLCQANQVMEPLVGHTDYIAGLAVTRDGKRLASAGFDGTVRVWDAETGRELLKLTGHTGPVFGLDFSPDGKRLASVSGWPVKNGELKIWDVDPTGPAMRDRDLLRGDHLKNLTGERCDVVFSPGGERVAVASGKVAGEKNAWVRVFDAATGREAVTLAPAADGVLTPGDSILTVAFSPDGTQLAAAAGSYYHTTTPTGIQVWNAHSGQTLGALKGHPGGVIHLTYSPDGRTLASCSFDRTVRLWDAKSYQEVRALRGHEAPPVWASFRRDGRRLATAGEDGTVRVWNTDTGEELLSLRGHTAEVYAVTYFPAGDRLASAGMDRVIRVWDASGIQQARTLGRHAQQVSAVAVSPDGRWLASAGGDRVVFLWDLQSGGQPRPVGGHDRPVCGLAFSPDSSRLATASGDWKEAEKEQGQVRLFELPSGRELFARRAHPGLAWTVAFSPDGRRLVSGGGENFRPGAVRAWDAASGAELPPAIQYPRGVNRIAFTRDGRKLLVVLTIERIAILHDATTEAELLRIPHDEVWPAVGVFNPSGTLVVTSGGSSPFIRVWDAGTGKLVRTLRGHTGDVMALAFSPDGRRLASGSYDQTIKLWDVETGQEVLTLRGHTAQVLGLAFSPDGHQLFSCGDDQTVRVWDARPLPDAGRPGPTGG
jgi:WD40 repeat protein